MSKIIRLIDWIASRERKVLASWIMVVAGTCAFAGVTQLVASGWTQSFDESFIRALRQSDDHDRPLGPAWLAQFAREITALGSYSTLLLVVMISTLFLAVAREKVGLRTLLGATLSGYTVMLLLKRIIQRPRPDIVKHLADFHSTSFPSGHSMMSAVVYVTLAFQLLRVVKDSRLRATTLSAAVVLTSLVGTSRVFLGVHFPTDVLAGWTAGLVWSLLWLLVVHSWEKRHETARK